MASRERPRSRQVKEDRDSLVNLREVTSFECFHEPLTAFIDQGESVLVKSEHSKDALSLLKILAGVIPPATGVASVLGARCNSWEGRSVVSSFGGSLGPYLGATLLQNLLLSQGALGSERNRAFRAHEVIEEFGLESLKETTLKELDKEELSLANFACFSIQSARLSCMFDQIDLESIDNRSRIIECITNLRVQGRTFVWLTLTPFLSQVGSKELMLRPKLHKG